MHYGIQGRVAQQQSEVICSRQQRDDVRRDKMIDLKAVEESVLEVVSSDPSAAGTAGLRAPG